MSKNVVLPTTMGGYKLSKGDKLNALHQALLNELGSGTQLNVAPFRAILMEAFDLVSRQGAHNLMQAMEDKAMIEYERGESVLILPGWQSTEPNPEPAPLPT